MTTKTTNRTLESARKLAQELDEAQRKAAEAIRPAHRKALDEARAVRDELAVNASEASRRDRLARIIEAATDARSPNPDSAALTLAQLAQQVAAESNATPAVQRTGAYQFEHFRRHSAAWTDAQRVKALDALVLAARGEVDAGLIEFDRQWSGHVSIADLEELAALADADALAQYRAERERRAAELAEAQRLVGALEQATPRLFILSTGEGATIAIRNHRPGDITLGGIRFTGGHVTELSPEQFDRVRDESGFEAHRESGNFEITAPAQLAEPI